MEAGYFQKRLCNSWIFLFLISICQLPFGCEKKESFSRVDCTKEENKGMFTCGGTQTDDSVEKKTDQGKQPEDTFSSGNQIKSEGNDSTSNNVKSDQGSNDATFGGGNDEPRINLCDRIQGYELDSSFQESLARLCESGAYSQAFKKSYLSPYQGGKLAAEIPVTVDVKADPADIKTSRVNSIFSLKLKISADASTSRLIPKIYTTPVNVDISSVTIGSVTTEKELIPSSGGDHAGGEKYQSDVTISGLFNGSDKYMVQNDNFIIKDGNCFVVVDKIIEPGKLVKSKNMILMGFSQGENEVIIVGAMGMVMANMGFQSIIETFARQFIQKYIDLVMKASSNL
ncbi:MAG: hypothetical protein HQK54_13325 [Oligoflexales bacterium]|nr:hypothetical protein [Oligoflexales bacterium]